ncbi:MAG: hypothetical protein J6S57_01825 [Alphaproteobacteria bacterium]|nr:hypothetical protein [Alphaproteobacteria bacterium]
MIKIKSFFVGILLLAMTFAMVVLVTLIYRSEDQFSVKSYIFQTNDYANERVGALQNLDDMSAIELRNKLIKKYVSEYFLVVPGEENISNRAVLRKLSTDSAYKQWISGEAKKIAEMSEEKMFRRIYVSDADIAAMNIPDGYDYYNDAFGVPIMYSVRYMSETWSQSNAMWIEPVYETGSIDIEVRFIPKIRENINIRKYLESGGNPVGLFWFKVTRINDGENK